MKKVKKLDILKKVDYKFILDIGMISYYNFNIPNYSYNSSLQDLQNFIHLYMRMKRRIDRPSIILQP